MLRCAGRCAGMQASLRDRQHQGGHAVGPHQGLGRGQGGGSPGGSGGGVEERIPPAAGHQLQRCSFSGTARSRSGRSSESCRGGLAGGPSHRHQPLADPAVALEADCHKWQAVGRIGTRGATLCLGAALTHTCEYAAKLDIFFAI